MTKKEILAMKAGEELDGLVADILDLPKANYNLPAEKNYYSTSIFDAWQVEEKVKGLGLIEQYATHLLFLTSTFSMNAKDVIFALAHASPETRCKAALLAVKEKEEKNG